MGLFVRFFLYSFGLGSVALIMFDTDLLSVVPTISLEVLFSVLMRQTLLILRPAWLIRNCMLLAGAGIMCLMMHLAYKLLGLFFQSST